MCLLLQTGRDIICFLSRKKNGIAVFACSQQLKYCSMKKQSGHFTPNHFSRTVNLKLKVNMAKIGINLTTGSLQQKEVIVGIDLGTTNSLIAMIHPDTKEPVVLKEFDHTTLV